MIDFWIAGARARQENSRYTEGQDAISAKRDALLHKGKENIRGRSELMSSLISSNPEEVLCTGLQAHWERLCGLKFGLDSNAVLWRRAGDRPCDKRSFIRLKRWSTYTIEAGEKDIKAALSWPGVRFTVRRRFAKVREPVLGCKSMYCSCNYERRCGDEPQ